MLNGSISDKIILFALPLAASSILQQLFNSADVAVVGRYAGKEALAAVGATGPVVGLLINLFVGLSIGANVVTAKYLGQQNKDAVKKAVHTSMLLALISGFILLALGQAVLSPLLVAMSMPKEVLPLAALYMRIYLIGMPFTMIYNFGSAILRSIGDTRRPLLCLFASGIINLLLNLFFVIVCHMSVEGVAIATVSSNAVSSFLVVMFLVKEKSLIHLDLKKLGINRRILGEVAGIGVPAGIQGMVFSFSNVCIQGALNGFGPVVMAGSAAAINFEYYTFYVLNAFSQTCTTFVSQNVGADNIKRCGQIILRIVFMAAAAVLTVSVIFLVFDKPLLSLFTKDDNVMKYGLVRMHTILIFQVINSVIEVFSGSLRGMGHSAAPAFIALAGVCGFRLCYVFTYFKAHKTLVNLFMVYPFSWGITALAMSVCFGILFAKKYRERYSVT